MEFILSFYCLLLSKLHMIDLEHLIKNNPDNLELGFFPNCSESEEVFFLVAFLSVVILIIQRQ